MRIICDFVVSICKFTIVILFRYTFKGNTSCYPEKEILYDQ